MPPCELACLVEASDMPGSTCLKYLCALTHKGCELGDNSKIVVCQLTPKYLMVANIYNIHSKFENFSLLICWKSLCSVWIIILIMILINWERLDWNSMVLKSRFMDKSVDYSDSCQLFCLSYGCNLPSGLLNRVCRRSIRVLVMWRLDAMNRLSS